MIEERQKQPLSDILERIELTKKDRTDLEFYIDKKESENSNNRLDRLEDYVGISREGYIKLNSEKISDTDVRTTDFIKMYENVDNIFSFTFGDGFNSDLMVIKAYYYDENKNMLNPVRPILAKPVSNGEVSIINVNSNGAKYVRFGLNFVSNKEKIILIQKYPDNNLFAVLSNDEIDMITYEVLGVGGNYGSGTSSIGEI